MGLLTLVQVEERFSRWKISWEYGRYVAVHDAFDASWEGEEDGWVGNGLNTEAHDLESLVMEIEAIEAEM